MTGILHVAILCADRVAQERFYSKHFGFKRARVYNAGTPNQFVALKLGDTYLELFPSSDGDPKPDREPSTVGLVHIAIQVPDVAKKRQELIEDGIEAGPLGDASFIAEGMKYCFVKDPEGNSVELVEGWVDDPNPPHNP